LQSAAIMDGSLTGLLLLLPHPNRTQSTAAMDDLMVPSAQSVEALILRYGIEHRTCAQMHAR
jgi:hypothetical protein